ncbi:MAG TPA: hypothetical protein ENO23_08795 [Alphaproteobacteria bacterium]|nr:hypothetical protein [Alphaproteobacteria bacterium]
MSSDSEIVQRHVAKLREEAEAAKIPSDVLGRLLVQEAIEIWKARRDWPDIARELNFIADNLDPDTDYEFMRP